MGGIVMQRVMMMLYIVCCIVLCGNVVQAADNSESTMLNLQGEWEFYHHLLLQPRDFVKERDDVQFVQVPRSWRSQSTENNIIDAIGYGTYRYILTIPKQDIGAQKALSLYYVGSAYRIWIDGKEYPGLGVVGTSASSETPKLQRHIIPFQPIHEQVEIVIQVSNHSFREGGILSDIVYGDANKLTKFMLADSLIAIFIIGGSFIFGMYHFIIYFYNRADTLLLYLGLFSIGYGLRSFFLVEHLIFLFLPSIEWRLSVKAEYIVDALMMILVPMQFRALFPKDAPTALIRLFQVIMMALLIFILATPSEVFTKILIIYPFLLSIILYIIGSTSIKARIRKRHDSSLNLVSVTFVLLAAINDTFNYLGTFHSFYLMNYTFYIFIFLQTIIVSNRYRRILKNNKDLAVELETINATLEMKIEERTEELKQKNITLHQLQQARTRLLANVAHDIGSPIVGVQTYLQILKDDQIPLDRPHVFSQVIDRLAYVQQLNDDLLTLSKLEAHQLPLHFEVIQAKTFFEDFYASLFLEQQYTSVTIQKGQVTLPETCYLRIDKQRIRQALQNYVNNAIKFNTSTTNTITLHCFMQQLDTHDVIQFAVEDQGSGIAPDILPHIFERFFKQREQNSTGSGLGLAIVKEIIEQHDGQVGVSSEVEKGSTFYFTLPSLPAEQLPLDD